MKVVAISGWKRSGKDTAANYLVDEYGYNRVAFADVLKDMVAQEYDIPRGHCDDPQFKEAPLHQYPVEPKDNFSRAIAEIMKGEFRDYNGKPYWTPRALCILKGSVNRSVTSQFWTNKAIELIINIDLENETRHLDRSSLFVISDLRYNSEIAELRNTFQKDLITIRINRFDTCDSTDSSERDLDNTQFDIVIENRESLSSFLRKLEDSLGL